MEDDVWISPPSKRLHKGLPIISILSYYVYCIVCSVMMVTKLFVVKMSEAGNPSQLLGNRRGMTNRDVFFNALL